MFFGLSCLAGFNRKRRAQQTSRCLLIESLEPRQMLAGDLTLTSPVISDVAASLDPSSIELSAMFSVSNVGDEPIVAEGVVLQAVFSTDNVFGNADDIPAFNSTVNVDLAAGGSAARVLAGSGNVADYVASNYLLVKVDNLQAVAEGNENNNIAVISLPGLPVLTTSQGPLSVPLKKAVRVDPGITFTDTDTTNFNGGTLRVSVANDQSDKNILSVLKTKTTGGVLKRVKGELRLGKTVIASVVGGTDAQPLSIQFTSEIIRSLLQTIASAVSLQAKKGTPGSRTVQFQVMEPGIVTGPIAFKQVNFA